MAGNMNAINALRAAIQKANAEKAKSPIPQQTFAPPPKELSEQEIQQHLRTTEINIDPSQPSKHQPPQQLSEELLTDNIRKSLQSIQDNFTQKEIVAKDIRYILSTLQSNPELRGILLPDDVGTMVKGLQACYGMQIAKAQSTNKAKQVKVQKVNEISDMLSGMGID